MGKHIHKDRYVCVMIIRIRLRSSLKEKPNRIVALCISSSPNIIEKTKQKTLSKDNSSIPSHGTFPNKNGGCLIRSITQN